MIVEGFLSQGEMDALSRAAFEDPSLADPGGASASSAMYDYFRSRPGAIGLVDRDGERPVGFAYGYPDFRWADHTSDWDDLLRDSLADPDEIVGAFVVMCLMVHPEFQHQGRGPRLLQQLVSGYPTAWLATRDAGTPAQALYAKTGWREIGRGPLAGPGGDIHRNAADDRLTPDRLTPDRDTVCEAGGATDGVLVDKRACDRVDDARAARNVGLVGEDLSG